MEGWGGSRGGDEEEEEEYPRFLLSLHLLPHSLLLDVGLWAGDGRRPLPHVDLLLKRTPSTICSLQGGIATFLIESPIAH